MLNDPLYGYASCPVCGGGHLARTETPVRTKRAADGGWIRSHSRVVVCRSCGEVVYEKEHAERIEPAAPVKDEAKEEAPPRDRFELIEVD